MCPRQKGGIKFENLHLIYFRQNLGRSWWELRGCEAEKFTLAVFAATYPTRSQTLSNI